jgi:hypothetical protein
MDEYSSDEDSLRPSESASQVSYNPHRQTGTRRRRVSAWGKSKVRGLHRRKVSKPAGISQGPSTAIPREIKRDSSARDYTAEQEYDADRLQAEVESYRPNVYSHLPRWRTRQLQNELRVLTAYSNHWQSIHSPIYPPVDRRIPSLNMEELKEASSDVIRQRTSDQRWKESRASLLNALHAQQQQLNELVSPKRTFECAVCGDEKRRREFPDLITEECRHSVNCCMDCLEQWIESQLESQGWDRIKCPDSSCNKLLRRTDMKECASPEAYARCIVHRMVQRTFID